MGEIKSTLELAMERTRDLVPSREEREEMTRKERMAQVQADVRRLLEGDLRPAVLAERMALNEENHPEFPWREDTCREVAAAIVPGNNHEPALAALRALDFPGLGVLEGAVRDMLEQIAGASQSAIDRVRKELADAGIRGSAVVPNWAEDSVWQQEHARLREQFAARRDRLLG